MKQVTCVERFIRGKSRLVRLEDLPEGPRDGERMFTAVMEPFEVRLDSTSCETITCWVPRSIITYAGATAKKN